jgi:DNA-directed RNA polymerase subunit RPC12/RpoP
MTRRYLCAACYREFITDQDDEIAQAEAVQNFGCRGDSPDMAVVCEYCYKEIMAWVDGTVDAEHQKAR